MGVRRAGLSPMAWLLIFFTATQFGLPAVAQTGLAQADRQEELLRTPKRILETDETIREAEQQRDVLPTRKVTYADVLANPDDIELNLDYAQNQIANGDVLGASATFERILLINPNHARARLLYAIVLFRLDNLQEAERELEAVSKLKMPESLRIEIDRYLDQIRLRRKTTRYALTVSAGSQYDWNRNAAPSSNRLLVSDFVATIDGSDIRTHDIAYTGLVRLEFDHDLEYQANHRVKGAISHYGAEQRTRDELDLHVTNAEIGLVHDATPYTLLPLLYVQSIDLANNRYARNFGVRLRGEHQYDPATRFFGYGEFLRQEYFAIPTSTTAPDRSGQKYTIGMGVNYSLSPTMRISAEANHIVKQARRNFESYDGYILSLSHNWLLGKGMFLVTSLSGELDRYGTGDPSVSSLTRHDRIGRVGMTFGIPLDTLISTDTPIEVLRDFYLTVSVSASRNLSNITNYTYNNRTASVQLTKRWEF